MEITLKPEIEAKLRQLASEAGEEPASFLESLISDRLQYDEWVRAEGLKGLEQLDRGEWISHEEVEKRIRSRYRS